MVKALINCTIYSASDLLTEKVIVCEDGIISSITDEVPGDTGVVDLGGAHIAPGLIDIQINGGEELYFSDDPGVYALQHLYESSLKHGATHILPCLISSPKEKILQAIETVQTFQQTNSGVIGMHLEGPFLNPAKRGAHSADIIRSPENVELEEIIRYGKGAIKMITIAPELFTDEQLDMLLESGITISAGHSNMNYEQAQYYFNKGIRLVTHLYNAMTQMGHREPGIVGAVFNNEDVYAPIILDGAHCHYAAAKVAHAIKRDKLILLSDAAFLGRKKQSFDSPLLNARLIDGYYRNAEGNLAGAAISMIEAVRNAVEHLKLSLPEAIEMATIRVARALKMEDQLGKIAKGYPASFICFDPDFNNCKTFVL
ncbi:MAG: N-acetylglucosamine-6-phosphate deacetylase [Chitinophagaceae bacterium]|nr:MAG: N-acetylglucosamine-6-phosphate deacetylase [Chitinophagaceae bacterium]